MGRQTALFVPYLQELGHDVTLTAVVGLQQARYAWRGLDVYPCGANDPPLVEHARRAFGGDARAGLVFAFIDAWRLPVVLPRDLRAAAWAGIEFDPLPRPLRDLLSSPDIVSVAMSRWGQRKLRAAGVDPVYVPHAFDPSTLQPADRNRARDALGLPRSAFVAGFVGANRYVNRKAIPEQLAAFRDFRRSHDDAVLFLVTAERGGVDIPALIEALSLEPGAVRFCDQYEYAVGAIGHERLAEVYSAFDVLLNCSRGESFGLAPLEAAACGTPSITGSFSAMGEIGVGWKVSGHPHFVADIGAWNVTPEVAQIAAALEAAYHEAAGLREAAVRHAEPYAIGRVVSQHLEPALSAMLKRLGLTGVR